MKKNAIESLQTSYDHYKSFFMKKNDIILLTNMLRYAFVASFIGACFLYNHVFTTSQTDTEIYEGLAITL